MREFDSASCSLESLLKCIREREMGGGRSDIAWKREAGSMFAFCREIAYKMPNEKERNGKGDRVRQKERNLKQEGCDMFTR
jgi:hypothetical protein